MEEGKTREQLEGELEDMRQRQSALDTCRREFIDVQRRYEGLLESAPDAMVYVDRGGRIVHYNAQLERLFGYGGRELVGRDLEILIPERFRARHHGHIAEYFLHPHVRLMGSGLKIFGLRKDGGEFPADISLSPLESEGETLTIAAIRDITERRRAEEQIERNYHIQRVISSILKISLEPIALEEQMERVLDLILTIPDLALHSRGSIYVVEDEPEVLVLKAPRASSAGTPLCERISFGRCLCGKAASSCAPVFADCIDERHEIRYRDDVPHGHYCVPITAGGGTLGVISITLKEGHQRKTEEEGFLTAAADTLAGVIERYRSSQERERLSRQLSQAEKLAALGRITANIADEMRNPLTSVGGFARRLQRKLSGEAPEREYVEFIVAEVTKLEAILRNVLILSRAELSRREAHDIRTIIEDVVRRSEALSGGRSVAFRTSYGDLPPLHIDRASAEEVIGNILSNALDAMPGGGTITIVTEKETVREKPYGAVRIEDTGIGIPEGRLAMVFEPFFTTKLAPKGTGLGLSIVKKVMEDHGGLVRIESKEGEGTTVTLYFPLEGA